MSLDNEIKKYAPKTGRIRQFACAAAFLIGVLLVAIATQGLVRGIFENAAARTEYSYLREISHDLATVSLSTPPPAPPGGHRLRETAIPAAAGQISTTPLPESAIASLEVLAGINPDFVGWIVIPGTTINYPVVRGTCNSQYLRTTFKGKQNTAGAIFMDYRCTRGFNEPATLIYGHNMRDSTMFSPLTGFLNQEFILNHPEVIVIDATGEKLIYRILEAQHTDAWNPAYSLDTSNAAVAAELFGIDDYGRVLILSTCLDGADRNSRLLVYAVMIEN